MRIDQNRTRLVLAISALAPAVLLFVTPALPPPAAGERYALLVGVNEYEKTQLTSLAYPENDVTALAEVLRGAGYARVVLLTRSGGVKQARYLPTGRNIRRELRGLLEDRREGDTVLVAFAGHGLEFEGSDEPYFCPMDARVRDRSTLISLAWVYAELQKCPARDKVLLSDACRSDPLARVTRASLGGQVFSPRAPGRVKPPENVVALFACSPGEFAHESEELKHGVFFYYVIDGLKGKAALPGSGEVTLGVLTDYVQRRVADRVKEEFGPEDRQRPELVGRYSSALALVKVAQREPLRPGPVSGELHRPPQTRVYSADRRFTYIVTGRFVTKQSAQNQLFWKSAPFSANIDYLLLTPDEQNLFVLTGKDLQCLDAFNGRALWKNTAARGGIQLSFSGDGREVLVHTQGGETRRFEARTGRPLK